MYNQTYTLDRRVKTCRFEHRNYQSIKLSLTRKLNGFRKLHIFMGNSSALTILHLAVLYYANFLIAKCDSFFYFITEDFKSTDSYSSPQDSRTLAYQNLKSVPEFKSVNTDTKCE